MKPTKSILILLTLLLISNCGDKVREETKESYDGNTKTLMKFKGNVFKEVLIEQITYTKDGDTLILEKPLEKLKILRSYYENGNIKEKQNFKNGKQYGKYTSYYENGHIKEEKNFNYVNGFSKRDGKYISYYENGGMKVKSNFKMENKMVNRLTITKTGR